MNIKYIVKLGLFASTLLLSACLSLPEQQAIPQHFTIKSADSACKSNQHQTIQLVITNVATGLNNDRVIQISRQTGEVSYINNMRWPNEVQTVVQQRLAADLESAGFSVITSHHFFADSQQLLCEVRALNLITSGAQNQAHFALSCHLAEKNKQQIKSVQVSQFSNVEKLSSVSINNSLSESYSLGFDQLCKQIINDDLK